MQIEHFHYHAIFLCKFVSQAIVSNHLKQIISNTNQYALSCQSFPKFKSFRNYSNILELEREFENKPKIVTYNLWNLDLNASFPPRQPLFKYNDNHILVGYSRSSIFSRNWNHLILITQSQVMAFQCQTSRYAQLTGSPTVFFLISGCIFFFVFRI